MQDCTMKITKQKYDEIMVDSNGTGCIPRSKVSKYFSPAIICGYGLYGTKAYEKDGDYWLDYKIGDSCD